MIQNKLKPTPNDTKLEVVLIFKGDHVQSTWHHPDLASVYCSLCGKGCENKTLEKDGFITSGCTAVNPFCG
jgi:hypothetical protein